MSSNIYGNAVRGEQILQVLKNLGETFEEKFGKFEFVPLNSGELAYHLFRTLIRVE